MQRKSYLVLCISLLAAAWFGLGTVAAIDLPASTWYAVLQTQVSNQLVWITANGEQARIDYPYMPSEKPPSEAERDLLISPDGRYGLFTARLVDNRMALGFFDFQQGLFMQIHTAQPNEIINLGAWNSFFSDTSGVAVSFYTLTNAGVTDWRIINFDPKTGNVLKVLQKSDNAFTEPAVGAGSYPYVFFAQEGAGYRFRMMPYAVGGSVDYDSFTWNPTTNAVSSDGMITTELDMLPTTNMIIETGFNVGLPSVALEGPIPILNEVTQRNSFEVAPTALFHDPNASLFSPRWLRNGEWYAYSAQMVNNASTWAIRSVVGDSSFVFDLNLAPSQIYGTSEGYLLDYDGQTFIASTELDSSNQPVIFEAAENDQLEVVYVTPIGSFFTLSFLAAPGLVPGPTNTPAADVGCSGAPISNVMVGMPVRVTFTDGKTLNVRTEPNGTLITELAEGTEFTLIDGPVCADGYVWWKMSLPIQGGTLEGWVAEGNANAYFIEPWYGDGDAALTPTLPPAVAVTPTVPPAVVITLPPAVAVTPTLMILVNPNLVVTKPIIINPGFITDGDCKSAPAQTIAVGNTVAAQSGGSLSLRDIPTSQNATDTVANGTQGTVQEGPLCHGGFRMWKVAFASGQTGWVADGFGGKVYLVKQ